MTTPMKVGIVGCGNISNIYLEAGKKFDILNILAVSDLDLARAQAKAQEHSIPKAVTVDELLADPEIEIVINLTVPGAHYDVCKATLESGKHTYVEKPLSLTRAQGRDLLETAGAKGLRVGGAPDTFLGAALQTCRKLIDDGAIGLPIAATAFMLGRGVETWHPNPEFFFKSGGGPMFDMGPYYLSALVSLLGPLKRVTGSAQMSFPERLITSQPLSGQTIVVETPTHIAGVMDFAGGAVGTIITSFDVWAHNLPPIEIHGSEGSLSIPDPNMFNGTVKLYRDGKWEEVPLTHGYADNSRGIGVADMAYAIQEGRPHRASGELTFHVLDAMHGFLDASQTGKHYLMESQGVRPEALPEQWPA
jgi:predicted dehydrogenase